MRLYSIGHGARDLIDFLQTLRSGEIRVLADVRSFPRSRRHRQFNQDTLDVLVGDCDVEYRWIPDLGGRRKPTKAPSPKPSWQVAAFRSYAD